MAASQERELRMARLKYIGAVRSLNQALQRFIASDVPLDIGEDHDPAAWTPAQIAIMANAGSAFNDVVNSRTSWDLMRRHRRPSH
jgi:hypothetical protein